MNECIVIGGGPAGISCALALSQMGMSNIVLEGASREAWRAHVEGWRIPAPAKTVISGRLLADHLQQALTIRFGFVVANITRIDGSNALVAWHDCTPEIGRWVVIALRQRGEGDRREWPFVERSCSDPGPGRSSYHDVFVCGAPAARTVDDSTAWRHGIQVAMSLAAAANRGGPSRDLRARLARAIPRQGCMPLPVDPYGDVAVAQRRP